MARILLAFVLAVQMSTLPAATSDAATRDFKVLKSEFGVLTPFGFRPAARVPFRDGQSFGWVIQVETRGERIRWREEFSLPAAPQTWQVDEKSGRHTLSADRRTSILEQDARVEDGLIYNFWTIAPGDPRGRHRIRVMIEGFPVATFDFDVE